MRVYVAGSWAAREFVKIATVALRANGIDCTNNWMDREAVNHGERRDCALSDLAEVEAAEAVLLLNTTQSTGGGMHFETGYAYKAGKRIFVVFKRSGVFHDLPGVEYFPDLSDFIAAHGVKADCGCAQR